MNNYGQCKLVENGPIQNWSNKECFTKRRNTKNAIHFHFTVAYLFVGEEAMCPQIMAVDKMTFVHLEI